MSMLLGMFDWVADFFKALFDMIPKVIYLLYASLACVLDVLQLFFRKLAGLDVYYIDGKPQTGDLVTNFIGGILGININGTNDSTSYSALSTVFWAFVVFGIIICFVSIFVSIIKSHYTYDDKGAKGPMQYVYTGIKSVINMVAVPVIIVLGLYVSQSLLTAIDNITSTNSGTIVSMYGDKVNLLESVATSDQIKTGEDGELIQVEDKDKTYIYYDIFGFGGGVLYGNKKTALEGIDIPYKDMALIGAKNQTFSGSMFRVAAYNANRARTGQIQPQSGLAGTNDDEIFGNATESEELAEMIDTAFANNLHLKESMQLKYGGFDIASPKYFTNFLTWSAPAFSKFNVGLVWYYYDLWQFNFIIGFAGVIVCVSIFINIILGLMTRLFMCIGLFLIMPPMFGLAPLDGGEAGKNWRKKFVAQVLMTYGAVVGMNIMFLILPYINNISFFNIGIADYFAQALVLIVGLITVKGFIGVVSELAGGANAEKSGGEISEQVGKVASKATMMTVGAAKVGARLTAPALITRGVGAKILHDKKKEQKEFDYHDKQDEFMKTQLQGKKGTTFDEQEFKKAAKEQGFKRADIKKMADAAKTTATEAGTKGMTLNKARENLTKKYEIYNKSGVLFDTKGYGKWWKENQTTTVGGKIGKSTDKIEKKRTELANAVAKTGNRVKIANQINSLGNGRYSFGKTAEMVGDNIKDIFDESKLVKEFKGGIWKKPDPAKETSKATKATLDETKQMRSDIRQGFEELAKTMKKNSSSGGGKKS